MQSVHCQVLHITLHAATSYPGSWSSLSRVLILSESEDQDPGYEVVHAAVYEILHQIIELSPSYLFLPSKSFYNLSAVVQFWQSKNMSFHPFSVQIPSLLYVWIFTIPPPQIYGVPTPLLLYKKVSGGAKFEDLKWEGEYGVGVEWQVRH
jgi:hypothetical protein